MGLDPDTLVFGSVVGDQPIIDSRSTKIKAPPRGLPRLLRRRRGARLKLFPNKPDQVIHLLGRQFFLERGHAVAAFRDLFQIIRIRMAERVSLTEARYLQLRPVFQLHWSARAVLAMA